MLSPVELKLLTITGITFVLVLWNRVPVEIVALSLLLALGFSGLVPENRVLSGFSSSVVITLLGLFVITKALEETGVIQQIADRLNRLGNGSEVRLITVFMLAGAGMSLVMNNVAAGAVLLPAAVRVARLSKIKVSKLLIPMSFGTLLGGMATILTTANIVMSTLLSDANLEGLGMLDFIPTGGVIVVAGVFYMVLVGRHLLPDRGSISEATFPADLQSTYQLDERMWEVHIAKTSRLVGLPLEQSGIGQELGLTVLAVWHGHQTIFPPRANQVLQAGDCLLILGRKERLAILLDWGTQLRNGNTPHSHNYHVHLTEVVIPPRSLAIGQTLRQLDFRQTFDVTVVAIWREGRSFRTDVGEMELRVGDALLVIGYPEHVKKLALNRNYLVPASSDFSDPVRPHKATVATLIAGFALILAIFELFPIPLVMLAGGTAMVLTGCLSMEEFYAAIEWKVIFLIAGMLPLGIAMMETGLAARAGFQIAQYLSVYPPILGLLGIFLFTVLITQVLGGQVTALLVGPIAISTALQMNVSPQAMSVTVAIACSTAFLTPIAHPVNILMMGPGGYQFNDFFKVGLGMTLVTLAALTVSLVVFWHIY